MKILSIIKDERIIATSVLVEMTTLDYLELIKGAEENLDIQRKAIKGFKPYDRLRQDLKQGCIIPPIVLGVKKDILPVPMNNPELDEEFLTILKTIEKKNFFIIDGLQRTLILQSVQESLQGSELHRYLNHPLRIEIWPDISLSALTYRMILLNAGQKPMSLKHQLEVVSRPLCDVLLERYQYQIIINREKDSTRRSGAGQYKFSIIASAFQVFVQKSPHIDLVNEVIAELKQIDVLSNYGDSLSRSPEKKDLTEAFIEYIGFLIEFDKKLCIKYPYRQDSTESQTMDDSSFNETKIPTGINLLTRNTFHLGLAAAYSWCLEYNKDELEKGKEKLLTLLDESIEETDPLALERMEKIQTGFRRKDNTGEQTRSLIFNSFKEFFRSGGVTPIEQCWTQQ